MDMALAEFRQRGITDVRVMVGEDLPANAFYKKMGFEVKRQYRHHGCALNAYEIKVPPGKGDGSNIPDITSGPRMPP